MLQGYGPSLMHGALLTLSVAFASLCIAFVLGLIGATAKLSRSRIARALAQIYTTAIRAVPDLVLMLLVFYGGQIAVNALGERMGWDYLDIDPFVAGVLTIGFIFGAYLTEVLRGAFMAVPPGQREAALAFERYDLVSAPVVSEDGHLLGRVTVARVVDFIREKSEDEQLAKAGLREEEQGVVFAVVLLLDFEAGSCCNASLVLLLH